MNLVGLGVMVGEKHGKYLGFKIGIETPFEWNAEREFLSDTDTYNICINCFMMASMAYKFYLLSKRSQEILGFYTNELLENMEQIQLPEEMVNNTLCISLPEITTVTPIYDYNLQSIGKETELFENTFVKQEITKSEETDDIDNDKVVVIIQDNGEPAFYRAQPDGSLIELEESEGEKYRRKFNASIVTVKKEERLKKGRKRGPMSFKMCSRCPVKYRFITKLKQHMMMDHNVTLFVCKVCQAFTENEQEYHNHMKTHTDIHQCAVCNTVFKKRSTIINHLKWHERMKNITENALQTENAHICEKCGKIMFDEESLRQHYDSVHYKKFTCYYCGRMYKGEMSFDSHIKKHEKNMEIGRIALKLKIRSIRVRRLARLGACVRRVGDTSWTSERCCGIRGYITTRGLTPARVRKGTFLLDNRATLLSRDCHYFSPSDFVLKLNLLRRMRELGGNMITEDGIKIEWMNHLPAQIRVVLSVNTDSSLDMLEAMADKMMEYSESSNIAAVSSSQPDSVAVNQQVMSAQIQVLSKQLEKLTLEISELRSRGRPHHRRYQRSRSRSKSTAKYQNDSNRECGRRFVSLNRRNQHALCAHTAPTRRCPLCPALFHLRSMVNSHVKKVHLREHKRRNRVNKHRDVPWRTAPVPIQELSVDIQNDILELQAAHAHANDWTYEDSSQSLEMEHI
ncbi:hypothetical protein HW555_013660 [Spodoptera exigua]|uniref:C2H2-type domain-containing protein n=1 Tax=Spodoptera exigua TaxID=7107 RepID=A0A835KXY0_SPOEX|nr:hypothetical protein HW555_013660 [Spodoptera exigua]